MPQAAFQAVEWRNNRKLEIPYLVVHSLVQPQNSPTNAVGKVHSVFRHRLNHFFLVYEDMV